MPHRFVDLSIYLENDVVTDPLFMRPRITHQTRGDTVTELNHFFPGVTAEQIPGAEGFAAAEFVTMSTHNGTHLDAPYHFHPITKAKDPACAQHVHRSPEDHVAECIGHGEVEEYGGEVAFGPASSRESVGFNTADHLAVDVVDDRRCKKERDDVPTIPPSRFIRNAGI